MKRFLVEVRVLPREGILDPQGEAVENALHSLGFPGVEHVRMGRLLHFTLEADGSSAARERAEEMCRQLLANPVTEDFEVGVAEAEEARA